LSLANQEKNNYDRYCAGKPVARTPRGKLLTMMLLRIFIWGAWLPLIFGYLPTLGYSPSQ